MKIDILCSPGDSQVTHKTMMFGDNTQPGVGGSSAALLTMCELWSNPHDIRLYNDPRELGMSPFEQLPIAYFNPRENRDVLILFRTPEERFRGAKGLKIWWSCDQQSPAGYVNYRSFADKVVCISPHHKQHFINNGANPDDITVIDIILRTWDFEGKTIKKVPDRLIFTSVPERGLPVLYKMWPIIKDAVPSASLVITSDYLLWNAPNPSNAQHVNQWKNVPDVQFIGAVPRMQYIEELMKAQILVYPCTYDELFCISVAEAQVAGVYPVTSDYGALPSTNMGMIFHGDPNEFYSNFATAIIWLLQTPALLREYQEKVRHNILEWLNPDRIIQEWEDVFRS